MYHARKYRLYPDNEQEELCSQFFGCCRVVKNLVVEQNQLAHHMGFAFPNRSKLYAELKELRNDPVVAPWLRRVPAQVLQAALVDTFSAYQRFFAGQSSYPNFRRKINKQAFRVPQHVSVTRMSKRWGLVKLQGLGQVRFHWSRAVVGKIKSATVIREADGTYWVSILCEQRDSLPQKKPGEVVGVDLGIVVPVATSDGEAYGFTALKPKEKERLLRLQRQFARQARGSKRREVTRVNIAKLHARARRRRNDFAEQVSNRLTSDYAAVAFENLKTANMTRSASGTVEEPGRNVKQKSGLNRDILSIGWSQVTQRTQEKGQRRGCQVVKNNPAYSSQKCPSCGHVHTDNRVSRARFVCQKCGFAGHADVVAAANVKNKALVEGRVEAPASRKLDSAARTAVAARPGLTPWNPAGLKPVGSGEVAQSGSSGKREEEKGNRTTDAALVGSTRPNIAKTNCYDFA